MQRALLLIAYLAASDAFVAPLRRVETPLAVAAVRRRVGRVDDAELGGAAEEGERLEEDDEALALLEAARLLQRRVVRLRRLLVAQAAQQV